MGGHDQTALHVPRTRTAGRRRGAVVRPVGKSAHWPDRVGVAEDEHVRTLPKSPHGGDLVAVPRNGFTHEVEASVVQQASQFVRDAIHAFSRRRRALDGDEPSQ